MANQQNSYTGSQGTGTNSADFPFTFPSFTTGEVKVEVDNVVKTLTTHYTVENYNTTSGGTVRFTAGNIPTGTTPLRIFRQTDVESPKAEFSAGASLKAGELNDNFKQIRHALQEGIGAVTTDRKVQRFNIEADSIDGTLIADDVVDSEHYVAGSIDLEHMSANSVDSDQYVDGSIDGVHIANDQIDSQHYAAGSIDLEHMSANSVDSDQYVDGSIDLIHMSANSIDSDQYVDGSIDNVHLAADAIDGTKLADNSVNSEHYVDGSIDHEHLNNDVIDGDNIQDDVVNSEHIAAGALDNEHYAAGSITSDKLNGATVVTNAEQAASTPNDTSFFTTAAAEARYFNASTGETIKDGDTFPDNDTTIATTAAINDRIIDLVDDVGGFVPIANETSFPTSNPDVNNGTGTLVSIKAISSTRTPSTGTVTIANGSGSNTVTITGCGSTVLTAGFGVIVETTAVTHTYAFHRLVPKATEVTTVAGVSGNVTTVAGIASNVTTVAGIASNVTTVAGAVTNVNNVGGSIASVNSAAANLSSINTYGDQYQVASSNPSTDGGGNSLAEGDLYFNTTANELKVYNGSQWQGGVTASGNFASVTGNTFTGDNVYQDNAKLKLGTGSDLEIFHNASDSIINDAGTGDLKIQSGGSTKLQITSSGAELTGNLDVSSGVDVTGNITVTGTVDGVDIAALNTTVGNITTDVVADTTPQLGGDLDTNSHNINLDDDHAVNFGDDTDLVIKHSGSNGNITNSTGDLVIRTLGTNADDIFIDSKDDVNIRVNDTADAIKCIGGGATELYHSGTKKAETVSGGFTVTGNIAVSGTVDGIDIATDVAANTAKVTNATHTGEVTGATALTIADDVVDEANLKVSNSPTNGYYLQAQSGNTGGLTWAAIDSDSITEGNSKAEVIGSGTNDGEFKVTLQDATNSGSGATSLRQYTSGSTNVFELNPSGGNTSSNSKLVLNHITGTNAWSEIYFTKSGSSSGNSIIRSDGGGSGGYFDFYPEDGNVRFRITGSATFTQGHVQAWTDSTYDLGTNTNRWRNVYADDYYGSAANLTNIPAANITGTLPAIDGSNLTGLQAGATGGGTDSIFWENGQTVTTNYTITNNKNAMSAGPITINNGIVVTIGTGENWTIV